MAVANNAASDGPHEEQGGTRGKIGSYIYCGQKIKNKYNSLNEVNDFKSSSESKIHDQDLIVLSKVAAI